MTDWYFALLAGIVVFAVGFAVGHEKGRRAVPAFEITRFKEACPDGWVQLFQPVFGGVSTSTPSPDATPRYSLAYCQKVHP